MSNDTTVETNAFLADVANKLESAAANLESGSTSTCTSSGCESNRYLNAGFASKLVYTACYTLSYGVCFPIFVASHYVPKNNSLVEGLSDGSAAANQSVDKFIERTKNVLAGKKSPAGYDEFSDVVEDGVGALEPA